MKALKRLAEGRDEWALPWPCVHEFFSVVTHPKIYSPPTPLDLALAQIEAICESPRVVFLAETSGYWEKLSELVRSGRVAGPRIHDARIAALCLFHGVEALWTADRDFDRFPALKRVNPLLGSP